MKRTVAVITGEGKVTTQKEDVPKLKKGSVLIKVHASLISPGTEMGCVKGRREKPDSKAGNMRFGYANAGEILEIKGKSNRLKPGMRVAAMGGGYALHTNYAVVPVNLVVPIPKNVTYAQASYACLGATAMQAIRRGVPQLGEFGIVLGQGIVGNLSAQLARLSGARIIAWEGINFRIKIAKKCGTTNVVNVKKQDAVEITEKFTAPYGADLAIVAFGGEATEAFESVKKCMKLAPDTHKMGRIILVGGADIKIKGGAGMGNLDVRAASRTGPGYHDENYEYGNDYPNAFVQFPTIRNLEEIVQLISEKRLLVDPMTTHNLPLEKVGEAADLLIDHPDRALGMVMKMKH